MKIDNYGQMIYSEQDLCNLYLRDPDRIIDRAFTETSLIIDDELELTNLPTLVEYAISSESIDEFDARLQNVWHMPDSYRELDIAEWVLKQCNTEEELQRAGEELLLYMDRNLFPLLQYIKYLVDTMRENNIVWGVGRGSSVSSYVLYLIGIHKIDSLYFSLDVTEFLR